MITALTAENAKLKTELISKISSGSIACEKPKVLAPGMYAISPKYIPPQRRVNRAVPTPLPKKQQVTFKKPPRPSIGPTQENSSATIIRSLIVNARRAADHNRKLNVVDHNQFVIRSLKSVNTKTPQAKHSVNHTKKVWKATRNHNVNTTKTAWRPTGKRTASIRESGTSVLEDLKALSWKTCQEGSLLNLSDHRFEDIKKAKMMSKSLGSPVDSDKDEVALNDEDDDNDDDDNDDNDDDNDDHNDDVDNQDDDGQEYDEHDDKEQGDDDEQTDSNNDDDDFVHPKFSTHDEEDKEEDSFNPQMNEEETNEEAEVDALYRDANVNMEGRDYEITDAPRTISSSVSSGFVSNMLNPSPDTEIDSLFNLNTESASLVDVLVTNFAEPPLLSATTLPPPPTPLITHLATKHPVPTQPTVPAPHYKSFLNFGSLFGFDHRLKTLENNFSEFNQTNQFAAAVSSILGIVDAYLANKMHEAIKTKNLYKALVDAYESEKLILDTYGDTITFKRCRDDKDKDEEPSAGSNRGFKRRRAGKEPKSTIAPKKKTSKTTGKSTKGSKSYHKSADKSSQAEEPMHTAKDLEKPAHLEFETGVTEDQPDEETSQLPGWFQKLAKPPTPDRDWNKTLPDAHGHHLDWITIRRDGDKLYKFKEGDFNRLRIQDIEDMLLFLVQGKLTNLTVKERLDFNVSLRISGLKRREAYSAYSNPRGFTYQNKDKKNRLMRINELHKFSDSTFNDVRGALDDRLKGIRMKYLPQIIWRQSDRDKAGAMIQAIDKQLKTKRIMRSLEKFVGGRPYKGDFRLLYRYSNPMIQPEPEGSTHGYPLVSVEVLRFYTSAGNPIKEILLKLNLPDHRNKTEDTRQGINNDNQSRQLFGNQRTMTIAGLRETSRQSGSATDWDTVALKSNGYGHYAKECRKPEAALRLRVITRGIDDDVQTKLNKLHGKDSEVSPEESSSTGQPSETGYVPKS
ncbi:hypothetical protein Tco_0861143 [Tanacetum coccineum]|uniref:Uncharacterized protein n=1 Tax=Tanacetum coccineum TaxID=301880 RepID=A0ABQ5BKB4_9ASTR